MELLYKIYTRYTNIPKNKIKDIMRHDVFFRADECLKYGLVDKILKPISVKVIDQYYIKNPEYQLPTQVINIKTNFNNLYLYNEYEQKEFYHVAIGTVVNIQKILRTGVSYQNSEKMLLSTGLPKPIFLHISDEGQFNNLFEILPIINTILLSTIPIYSVIDGPIRESSLLYSMLCHKRFIYEYAYITIDLVSTWVPAFKYEDVIANTKVNRGIILELFKKYARLPKTTLDNLFKERFYFSAKDAVKYGLCDEVLK